MTTTIIFFLIIITIILLLLLSLMCIKCMINNNDNNNKYDYYYYIMQFTMSIVMLLWDINSADPCEYVLWTLIAEGKQQFSFCVSVLVDHTAVKTTLRTIRVQVSLELWVCCFSGINKLRKVRDKDWCILGDRSVSCSELCWKLWPLSLFVLSY